jgi:hypothetical protein
VGRGTRKKRRENVSLASIYHIGGGSNVVRRRRRLNVLRSTYPAPTRTWMARSMRANHLPIYHIVMEH